MEVKHVVDQSPLGRYLRQWNSAGAFTCAPSCCQTHPHRSVHTAMLPDAARLCLGQQRRDRSLPATPPTRVDYNDSEARRRRLRASASIRRESMRAVIVEHPGGPEVLKIGEIPDPVPGRGELLVRVRATALNRLDLLQREGRYPLPPGAHETIGVEMAGEVIGWGEDVTGWARGGRGCALLLGGGYAELVTVPAAMAIRIPAHLSFEQAAAIPEAFLTAYLNLFMLGGLGAGGYALIHAGFSGVGTVAIQLVGALV